MPSQSPGGYPGISAEEADAKCQALPMGTYQRMRWEAVRNALERVEPWVVNEPRPDVARWWHLLDASLDAALHLVRMTRAAEPVNSKEFARGSASLEGYWPLVKAEREGLDLEGWPSDPEAALAWFTGPSMADVAGRFSAAVCSALVDAGGGRSWGRRPADDLALSDPWYAGFRDRVTADLDKRLLPRAEWWASMSLIHRDGGVAMNKLEAEYGRFVEGLREAADTKVSEREPAEGTDGMQPGPDFMTFAWGDEVFEFNRPMQRAAIRHLWAAWESGHPRIQVERLRELVGSSDTAKPSDWFRGHPAWGKLIVTPRQGVYELQSPASAK